MDTMASEGCSHTHSGVTGYANIVADGPAKAPAARQAQHVNRSLPTKTTTYFKYLKK